MAQMIVRNLDDETKARLKRRARRHGRSAEEEVRVILRAAVATESDAPRALGSALARLFRGVGSRDDFEELRGEELTPARLRR
jgi:plasmid stability protein